jgi:NAD(P)-dependent dehydrogenase (short-subunit alcohol dehydrogenase family)
MRSLHALLGSVIAKARPMSGALVRRVGMSTHDKVALVTGATRGLGFETVRQLARTGVFVLLGARDLAAGQEKAAILQAEGLPVEAIEIDLNRAETIDATAAAIDVRFGRLDILINNAGILLLGTDDFPSVVDLQTMRDTYEVNFIGTVLVTQKLLPLIRQAPAGRIVNLSSSVGSLWWNGDAANPFCQHQMARLCRVQGGAQHADRATGLRAARHPNQGELGLPRLCDDGIEPGWRLRDH